MQASRYQMVVMLMGAATAGLASVAAVVLALQHASDPEHRLRLERLVLRPPQSSGVALWVHAQASKASHFHLPPFSPTSYPIHLSSPHGIVLFTDTHPAACCPVQLHRYPHLGQKVSQVRGTSVDGCAWITVPQTLCGRASLRMTSLPPFAGAILSG